MVFEHMGVTSRLFEVLICGIDYSFRVGVRHTIPTTACRALS